MVVAEAQRLTHDPDLKTYDCQACKAPWPCGPAVGQLAAIHAGDRVQLAIVMWGHLEDAIGVLHGQLPGVLFDRFIRWTGGES